MSLWPIPSDIASDAADAAARFEQALRFMLRQIKIYFYNANDRKIFERSNVVPAGDLSFFW